MENHKTPAETELGETVKDKAAAYTSINGNMFSFLDKKGSLSLNLSNDNLQAFMAKHDVPSVDQNDVVMQDYASMSHPVMDDQKRLKETFATSQPAEPTNNKS